MYLCHSCDEKSLFFTDFLINTIKILPHSTICGGVCNVEQGTKIVRGLNTGNNDLRMGPMLKFFQTVSVCTQNFHG